MTETRGRNPTMSKGDEICGCEPMAVVEICGYGLYLKFAASAVAEHGGSENALAVHLLKAMAAAGPAWPGRQEAAAALRQRLGAALFRPPLLGGNPRATGHIIATCAVLRAVEEGGDERVMAGAWSDAIDAMHRAGR